jgi:hypothetical protein
MQYKSPISTVWLCNASIQKSLYRRTGSADVAKENRYESRFPFLERKIFLANGAKEKVGPIRRYIVQYVWLGYTRHEPLYRYEDGNYWVHERFGE